MKVNQALKTILQNEGVSTIQASAILGRSQGYFGRYLTRGSAPGSETLAEIGNALGYDLLLRRRNDGTEIVIDPPRRDE